MKNLVKSIAGILGLLLVSGCGNFNNTAPTDLDNFTLNTKSGNVDIYFCTDEPKMFTEICQEYEIETGVKIQIFSPKAGQNYEEELICEIENENKPALFCVRGLHCLNLLEQKKYILNFDDKTIDDKFKILCGRVPESMRLSLNKKTQFGIPYGLVGYGLLVKTQIVSDLIQENVDDFFDDLQKAPYPEYEIFANSLKNYINESNKASKIKLNGHLYSFAETKTQKLSKLKSVFERPGISKINPAVDAVFSSALEAFNANDNKIELLAGPLAKYGQIPQAGDITGHSFFVEGCSNNSDHSRILPIKIPVSQDEIKIKGLSVENFNSSICNFAPGYYAINALSTTIEQKLAQDFILWLHTSKSGLNFTMNTLQLVPYNIENLLDWRFADENMAFTINATNCTLKIVNYNTADTVKLEGFLSRNVLNYLKDGLILHSSSLGAPQTWQEQISGHFEFANYAVEKWKKLK